MSIFLSIMNDPIRKGRCPNRIHARLDHNHNMGKRSPVVESENNLFYAYVEVSMKRKFEF